jgi:hypothetical protein
MDVDDKTASATQTDVNKSKEFLKKETKRAIKEIKDINDEKKKESDSELFNAKANVCHKNVFNTLHYAALQGNRNALEIIYDQCKGQTQTTPSNYTQMNNKNMKKKQKYKNQNDSFSMSMSEILLMKQS